MRERYSDYNPPIGKELREMYETALDGELRWNSGWELSSQPESDLDHVLSMFNLHDEVSWKYSDLFRQVNTDDASPMIYLHDAGEILAHDTPHSIPNYEAVRARNKRREAASFRLLTARHIEDIELRAYARQIFSRYETQNADDPVANYVRILDHVQAVRFGSDFVFNGYSMSKQMRLQKLNHITNLLRIPAGKLYPQLKDLGGEELLEWMSDEFNLLVGKGYRRDEVNREKNQLIGLVVPRI